MKEILTTAISNTVGLPLLGRTIDFIRDNVKEQTTSLAYSELNGSNDSLPIVLYGCIGTYSTVGFTNDTYTITKGAILYQGEIYQVPAMVATRANIGETIVFRIDSTTFQEGEPTLYTDGASRNTNLDRTIKIYNGATGSGIVDAVNLKHYCYDEILTFTGGVGAFQLRFIKKGNIITVQDYNTSDSGPGTLTEKMPIWARPVKDIGFMTHYPYASGSFLNGSHVVFKANGDIILGANESSGHSILLTYVSILG